MTPSLRPRTPGKFVGCYHGSKRCSCPKEMCSFKRKRYSIKQEEDAVREQVAQTPIEEELTLETPTAPVDESGRKVKISFGTNGKRRSVEITPKLPSPVDTAPPPPKRIKITIKQYPPREVEPNAIVSEVKEVKAPQMESKEVQVSSNEQYQMIRLNHGKNIMTRRVLNSEAYLHYIENLRSGSRKITKWDKSLNTGLPYRQYKQAGGRKKKGEAAVGYIKKNNEGQNVVSEDIVAQSLWKMRDQLLRSCLGMDIPSQDYSPYVVPKDIPKEYPPYLPL